MQDDVVDAVGPGRAASTGVLQGAVQNPLDVTVPMPSHDHFRLAVGRAGEFVDGDRDFGTHQV